jgi:hypothetical protein
MTRRGSKLEAAAPEKQLMQDTLPSPIFRVFVLGIHRRAYISSGGLIAWYLPLDKDILRAKKCIRKFKKKMLKQVVP